MFYKTIDFSKYSSIKVGGKIDVLMLEKADALDSSQLESKYIIGNACNLLIAPNAKNLIMLSKDFDYINDCGEYIEIGAMTPSGKIYRYFLEHNLFGLEFLKALPGSAGGLLKMNAGMKQYEMKDTIIKACINGKWSENLGLSYRQSKIDGIISALACAKILGFRNELVAVFHKMRQTHPKMPSAGSCFKNPQGDYAGRLLESVGLKGFRHNDMGFSQEHANFLVNFGNGKFEDALFVINEGKRRVSEAFGIMLEEEVRIIS